MHQEDVDTRRGEEFAEKEIEKKQNTRSPAIIAWRKWGKGEEHKKTRILSPPHPTPQIIRGRQLEKVLLRWQFAHSDVGARFAAVR